MFFSSRWLGTLVTVLCVQLLVVKGTIPLMKTSVTLDSRSLQQATARFLGQLLTKELLGCHLSLIRTGGSSEDDVFEVVRDTIFDLQLPVQMIEVDECCGVGEVIWRHSKCDAYVVYLGDDGIARNITNTFAAPKQFHQKSGPSISFTKFLQMADSNWDYKGKYIIFASSKNQLEPLGTTYKLRRTMDAIFICPDSTNKRLQVYTHWQYSTHPFRFLGLISANTSLMKVIFFPDKFANLQGFPLTVFTFAHAPTSFGSTTPDGEFLPTGGMDVLVIQILAKVLNFSVIWRDPGPDKWGFLLEDGTYTGIVEKIRSEAGDIGLADIFMDHIRTNYITYSGAYSFDSSCFLTPSPIEVPRWQALAFPFTLGVWIAFVCSVIISALLIPVFAWVAVGNEDKRFSSPEISLLYTVAMFTNQSVRQPAKSLRVFVLFLMVMGFVAAVSFSCNLTAYMMTKTYEDPITSFKKLDESGLELTGFGNIYNKEFVESLNVHIRNLAPRIQPTKSFDEDFKRVSRREKAVISNRQHLEYAKKIQFTNSWGESTVRIQEECYNMFNIAAILPKNSPLKINIDQVFIHLLSGGLTNKFFQDSLMITSFDNPGLDSADDQEKQNQEDQIDASSRTQEITLEHTQGAFFLFFLGILLAFIVLSAEAAFSHN